MFLSDEPITDTKQDLLGRGPFVEQLYGNLRRWPFQQALTIGLYGARGAGKTSFKNLLAKRLREGSHFVVADFNPWYYNSQNDMVQGFLTTLSQALAKEIDRTFVDEAQGIITDVRRRLSILPEVKVFGFGVDFSSLKVGEPSLDDLWLSLADLVAKAHKRIVILMDDIDRLPREWLLFMLKVFQLWSMSHKIVYILVGDRYQLEAKLHDELAADADFLRRAIAVDIYLPTLDSCHIRDFWQAHFQALVRELKLPVDDRDAQRREELYQVALGSLLVNLRSAKRLLNSLAVTLPLVQGRVDLADFVALEAVREFFPQVYFQLPQNKDQLVRGQVDPLVASISNHERRSALHRLLAWVFATTGLEGPLRAASPGSFDNYFPCGGLS